MINGRDNFVDKHRMPCIKELAQFPIPTIAILILIIALRLLSFSFNG